MKLLISSITICAVLFCFSGCSGTVSRRTELQKFINGNVAEVDPLFRKTNLAQWDAETTGRPDDFRKMGLLQQQAEKIYTNPKDYAFLKSQKESGTITDPLLVRQVDKLSLAYLRSRVNPDLLKQISDLDTQVREKYNTFRGTIDGKEVTNSDIYRIMTTETDSVLREKAWRASRQVGDVVLSDFLRLVRLRNQAARQMGFDNYHTYAVVSTEQDIQFLDKIFADLDRLTAEPFSRLKKELDDILAADYGVKADKLMPWHYHDPFFQRGPLVYDVNLDDYYGKVDVRELAQRFYAGIGLPVDDILAVSDLYDRRGKNPHAFSMDVDRHGDVRILCNLNNDERWAETILHELGHAVYSKYHDRNLPYMLREPAHNFTTEAVAMLFGRLSRNADWMQDMLALTDQQRIEIENVTGRYLRFQELLFIRWAEVMYNFEKQLYANPDQDLNTLWWDMVERYQMANRPVGPADAGWLSKLHFTFAPCYYHNYVLGELLASQLHHHIVTEVLMLDENRSVGYVDSRKVGTFLKEKVFAPGAAYPWQEMVKRATGETLNPRYFVDQFVY